MKLLDTITEKQWQAFVVEAARVNGWNFRYHTWDSRRSAAGFPDLVLCTGRDGLPARLLFLELKTEAGRVSEAQQAWIDALKACGQEAHVVRPSDRDFVVSLLGRRT